jgi:hypothetical protein
LPVCVCGGWGSSAEKSCTEAFTPRQLQDMEPEVWKWINDLGINAGTVEELKRHLPTGTPAPGYLAVACSIARSRSNSAAAARVVRAVTEQLLFSAEADETAARMQQILPLGDWSHRFDLEAKVQYELYDLFCYKGFLCRAAAEHMEAARDAVQAVKMPTAYFIRWGHRRLRAQQATVRG